MGFVIALLVAFGHAIHSNSLNFKVYLMFAIFRTIFSLFFSRIAGMIKCIQIITICFMIQQFFFFIHEIKTYFIEQYSSLTWSNGFAVRCCSFYFSTLYRVYLFRTQNINNDKTLFFFLFLYTQ